MQLSLLLKYHKYHNVLSAVLSNYQNLKYVNLHRLRTTCCQASAGDIHNANSHF